MYYNVKMGVVMQCKTGFLAHHLLTESTIVDCAYTHAHGVEEINNLVWVTTRPKVAPWAPF